jgi:hypothetical protein
MNFEVGYVGAFAKRLPVVVNSGFVNQWFCFNTPGCDNNFYFPVFTLTNQAHSNYHSLLATTHISHWHGIELHATYTFSKSLDNASNAGFPLIPSTLLNQALNFQLLGTGNPSLSCLIFGKRCGGRSLGATTSVVGQDSALTTTGLGQILTSPYLIPQDPLNFLRDEYGRSDFNSTHHGVLDYSWNLPGPPRSLLFGNWQISGIVDAQTGQPFTVFAGPLFGELTQRANIVSAVEFDDESGDPISLSGFGLASTRCGFATGAPLFSGRPGRACTGNSGRNSFTGPMYLNMDGAVQKGIPVFGEGRMMVVRLEVYNLYNRTNLYNPISALSLDGLSLNPEFGRIKSAHPPRRIQLAIRFVW